MPSNGPRREDDHRHRSLSCRVGPFVRSPAVHFAGVCLLVGSPLILAAGYILIHFPGHPGVVRSGDYALTELFTWHATHAALFEGARSHYDFQHLGPLHFYMLAPLYGLTGGNFIAIHLSVILINLAAMTGVLSVFWRFAGRTGLIWAAMLLVPYGGFVGMGMFKSPWAVSLTVMPFVLAVLLFTAVATGRFGYLPMAVFVSSFVVQTHMAYVPALAIVAVLSVLLCTVPRMRKWSGIRGSPSGNVRRTLLICLAVLAIAWAPTVIGEIGRPSSNVWKVWKFVADHGVSHTWREAIGVLVRTLAAFPRSCVTGEVAPPLTGGAAWPDENQWNCGVLAVGQVVWLLLSFCFARRGGRDFEVALSLICLALVGAFAASIRRIVGPIDIHLVFWMTSLSVLTLAAIGGSASLRLARLLRFETNARRRRILVAMILGAISLGCVRNTEGILSGLDVIEYESPSDRQIGSFAATCCNLLQRERVQRYGIRIVDQELWPPAAGLVVQLTKAGFPPAVDPAWVSMFGAPHAPPDRVDGMFLLCSLESAERLRQYGGFELVGETPQLVLFWGSPASKVRGRYSLGKLQALLWKCEGFWPVEGTATDSFCWSKGTESRLLVGLRKGQSHRLAITVAPLVVPNQTQGITVLLNGRIVGELLLDHTGWQKLEVTLPAPLVQDSNEIVFRYAYAESPSPIRGKTDTRELAVRFSSITFEPTGEERRVPPIK